MPTLFHFSDDPAITRFDPRPVRIPPARPPGRDWLNGPLVWAIEARRAYLYLFPRDCPRIVAWATPGTTAGDRARHLGQAPAVAWVERDWLDALAAAMLWRYRLPDDGFERIDDAGMWIARAPVVPLARDHIDDLPTRLAEAGVELRPRDTLAPLRDLWSTSLHVSGVRLRNARDWPA